MIYTINLRLNIQKMKLKILIILCVLAFAPTANAAKWYVNIATGNDTLDGTDSIVSGKSGPKKTINNAISTASWFDTIYIAKGIYQEMVVIDRPLIIRGNNWGISPLTGTRKPETIIVPPSFALGSSISGNSAVEITSSGIELDGIKISGDNPLLAPLPTKYGLEYEVSYGIGGIGLYNYLNFSNIIISNFSISGINLSSGVVASLSSKISNCKITTGDYGAEGIVFNDNFYTDLNYITIDSVEKGLSYYNYSDYNGKTYTISYLNIKSEVTGIFLNNFTVTTDDLIFDSNILNPFDPNIDFTGIYLNNLSSKGYANFSNTLVNNSFTGMRIKNHTNSFKINFTNNKFTNGIFGIYINQPSLSTPISLTFNKSELSGFDSTAIYSNSDNGLLSLLLADMKLSKSSNGIIIKGNTSLNSTNTDFSLINRYYYFLDSSANGLKPTTKIDATANLFEGVLGNNLTNKQSTTAEDKIRHYLDRRNMGWVLFKDKNLYVTTHDGNDLLTPAFFVASNNWNIYLDSIVSTEKLVVNKTINFYPHKAASIGRITMQGASQNLFLHGKIYLSQGVELLNGYIVATSTDTLLVGRNSTTSVLKPGNSNSYVKGILFIKYNSLATNYTINDTMPVGLGADYRPLYLNAKWPAGLLNSVIGINSYSGKAPIVTMPAGITHISDIRYWEITNPFNKASFSFNSVGFLYDSLVTNDLVNDPTNLRVIYKNATTAIDLGGFGNNAKKGSIVSNAGSSGFGFYTAGNSLGGNNMLSTVEPIALITTVGHCSNDSIIFSATNSSSDSAIVFWKWSITGPSTILSPENTITIKKSLAVAGDYTVTLIVMNKLGFTDTTTKSISIDDIPTLSYSSKSPCFPLAIDLKNNSTIPPSTSIIDIEWKINASYYSTYDLNFTPIISGIQKGYLKITLNTGCFDTINVSVASPVTPTITLIPHGDIHICSGDSIKILVNKSFGGTVVWNDGNTYDSLLLKANTFKKAIISISKQCFTSDSLSLTIEDRPIVNAGADLKTLPGIPVTLKGSSNAMMEWMPSTWLNDPTILSPVSRPLVTTKYVLRGYNTFGKGCEAKDSMIVTVVSDEKLFVPNLLTPNGDGHNDTWVLKDISELDNCDVYVFTREGLLVFSEIAYKNTWDGKRESTQLPDGYYVYVIENKSKSKVYTGILNIIK